MFVPLRTNVCFRSGLRPVLLAAILAVRLAAALPALAQGTHLWTQAQLEDFEKGTPQGVSLSSDGHLRAGPALRDVLTTPSTFVWSIAVDKSGTAYLGTASPATVLRVGPDGKPFTLFETKDLSVQVVRLGPDGALYAATLPGGKVYKLNTAARAGQNETSATVVFDASRLDNAKTSDARPHYIWDLAFDHAGRLYVATGSPGAVYRVDPAAPGAAPEAFFKSDEAHIRALAWDAKGSLIAGSDGSGLVYRIDPQGKGYVLFEAPRREITSVAVAANGTIYAASVGDKSRNPLPPLPVQGIGTGSVTVVQPGLLQAVNPSASLPEGTEIYALADGQAPRKLWTGKDEIVYALAARPDGLLALSGNRGRVFSIAGDGSYADVAHLNAQQGLSLAVLSAPGAPDSLLLGTGNTGKLCRFGAATDEHAYSSDVLDAGAMARFGRIEVEPGSTGYQILTRTGNVEQPIRGWSDWLPLSSGSVASPAGRFLQWKAVLRAGGIVGSVGVNYLPVNTAPVVDDVVVVPGTRVVAQSLSQNQPPTVNIVFGASGLSALKNAYDAGSSAPLQASKDRTSITVRWAAHDDDGDSLTYSLFLRGDGETIWRLLKGDLADKAYSFDAALIPDGGYQIKVVASDAPSHTPGDVLSGAKESDRFEVDTTPPVIADLKAAGDAVHCDDAHCSSLFHVGFSAEDASSPIAHAEYSLDAGPWQYIEPVGRLSDSRQERYELNLPLDAPAGKLGEHLITVRVYDRYENVGVAKTVIPAQTK
jgi:hypothetical protein